MRIEIIKEGNNKQCNHGEKKRRRGNWEFGHTKTREGNTESFKRCQDCGRYEAIIHNSF